MEEIEATALSQATRKLNLAREAAAIAMDSLSSAALELAQTASVATEVDHPRGSQSMDACLVSSVRSHADAETKAAILSDFILYLSDTLEIRNPSRLATLAQAYVWDRDAATLDEFVDDGFHVVLYAKRAMSPSAVTAPLVAVKPDVVVVSDAAALLAEQRATEADMRRPRSASLDTLSDAQIELLAHQLEAEKRDREMNDRHTTLQTAKTHRHRQLASTVTPSSSHTQLDTLAAATTDDDDDEASDAKKRRVSLDPVY
ncbi:Aste57867_17742 [Aphanomyces stellatus]|uniref:Aste57867_17742 protein n=1 Tax=Aphanomyces stellatus TaxID=120398 RepID=A0A485L8J6_9STRA|nr:hypothetical protein As57867_017681 [Aphanomyces stellatus]VFT94488.1 Aste57867_17742 [Aphanomyces stellatus]